jgi:hypothetical protein
MIFTPYEHKALTELLESSSPEDFDALSLEKATELYNSTLHKLKTLSNLTCFSLQEYSFLSYLLYDECEARAVLGIRDSRLEKLRDKLFGLSEALSD